jgi:hypothetical protein
VLDPPTRLGDVLIAGGIGGFGGFAAGVVVALFEQEVQGSLKRAVFWGNFAAFAAAFDWKQGTLAAIGLPLAFLLGLVGVAIAFRREPRRVTDADAAQWRETAQWRIIGIFVGEAAKANVVLSDEPPPGRVRRPIRGAQSVRSTL